MGEQVHYTTYVYGLRNLPGKTFKQLKETQQESAVIWNYCLNFHKDLRRHGMSISGDLNNLEELKHQLKSKDGAAAKMWAHAMGEKRFEELQKKEKELQDAQDKYDGLFKSGASKPKLEESKKN